MSVGLAQKRSRLWTFMFALAILLAFLIAGCGGSGGGSTGSGTGTTVSVQISPKTVTLAPGGLKTFTATVSNSTNTSVTWSATGGTIDQTGAYTAPSQTGTYTVTATSAADTSASASATVTVAKSNSGISVVVTPATATVVGGATKQFQATVTGTTNTAVTWTATVGKIDSTGLYTAPNANSTSTVTATSVADTTASGSASVTVTVPTVTITPGSPKIGTHESVQFSATISGQTDQSVTWTAQGGTITSSGLFTAGETPGSYSVFATSTSNSKVFASVTVVINPIKVTVKPTGFNMATGTTQTFTATVTGPTNTGVTWSASAGTITSAGAFTAPTTAQTVTITATSAADPSITGTATVTVLVPSDFFYNFNSGVPGVWSPANAATTPSGINFCGLVSDTNVETLTLSSLTTHTSVTVTFDLYVIGAWTGITGGNTMTVNIGGTSAFVQSFSNVTGDTQSFPDSTTSAPGTGATALNSLGYTHDPTILYNDAIYHITCNAAHTSDSITITFTGNLTGAVTDQSWGLKNVEVRANP